MGDRVRAVCATGALVVLFQLLLVGVASAHSLSLTAEAVCVGTAPTIQFKVTSWSTGPEGTNPQIAVAFNNVVVLTSAFVEASGNVISGSLPSPGGNSIVVSATAVTPWPSGEGAGQTFSVTVTVPDACAPGTGRFTGGGNQVDVGGIAKITRGLTIHCDLLLSNNLEINWDKGNNFHMLDHLQTIACFDDPSIDQTPPKAPIDTLVGVGTGRFNGQDGYRIEFTLVDAGEPGRNDEMAILITAPNGSVVLNVPRQQLTNGNLQAHFDQPHKNK